MIEFLREILRKPRMRLVVTETAFALFLFFVDPLGVVAYQARVIDNSIAVLTQFMHKSEMGKQLAVVLIDQEALDAWGADWPITYERTAGLIHALACAQAVGVFFDFTLSEKFNLAEGKSDLETAILHPTEGACANGTSPAAIKVFFGKADKIESPLAQSLDRDNRAFSIDDDAEDSVYPAGSVEFPDSPVAIGQATPAFGVIRSVPELWPPNQEDAKRACSSPDPRPKCWLKPLAIQWSGEVDPDQGAVSDTLCRGYPGPLVLVASALGITTEGRFETCPPILTLKAQDLFRDRKYIADHGGNPADLLRRRFVFVGTELAGLNDAVFSPVHGYLPGVFKHAVATDNLLSYLKDRTDYPTVPRPWVLGMFVVATYFVIELAKEFSRDVLPEYKLTFWKWKLNAREPNVATGAVLAIGFLLWCWLIYWWKWPLSLLFAVFGYYLTGVALLASAGFVLGVAKPQPDTRKDVKT